MRSASEPAAEGAPEAPSRPQLYACEWVAGGALLAMLGALALAGLAIDRASVGYTARALVLALPAALALGVALQALYRYADGGDVLVYLRSLRRVGWWIGWLRLWLACWLTSFAYFWLKVYVPRLRGSRLDEVIEPLERWLHLGVSPSQLSIDWLAAPAVAGVIDAWYALWLVSLVWCLAFFAASADERVRRGVVLSCVLLWALGSWLYVLLPVVGPVYAFPERWAELGTRLPRAAATQALLFENYGRVLEAQPFRHTLGVAALPSLHVGFHGLFTLWARSAAPLLFYPFLAATLLTLAGSLLTGWHYAIDGYLGLALAAGCHGLARRVEGTDAPRDR